MEEEQSEFNSSLQYLWRISNLIWSAHIARMETDGSQDEFKCLDELHIELDPEMNEEEKKKANDLRKKAKQLNKESVREYFMFLNNHAHKKGLILKKTQMKVGVLKRD